ncbi:hypothetical protein PHYBOEH_000844 [Phytophthora boehmeriae]|uniref:Uncharacterized protein n=1 Tax=Phytophthora boehmeriae TaxID=109152 RepID=A0A8T1V941_9STRA|nr:hypothetical protein PHYBOEH_000844 [Phytophthora boehmeriae]
MRGWSVGWEALFARPGVPCAGSTAPRLGVNYIQASAPTTTLKLPSLSAPALTVGQDLAKYGIAGVVWNCARALVLFFEAEKQFLSGRHVLELGADLEKVVPLTRQNVRAAGKQHALIAALTDSQRLDVCTLCWGEDLDAAIGGRRVDVVVASDCLYESTAHSALLATLLDLTMPREQKNRYHHQPDASQQHHVVVLLAYKQRVPMNEKAFFEAAANHFNIAVYSNEARSSSTTSNKMATPIEYFDEAIYICKLQRLRCDDGKTTGSLSHLGTPYAL